MNYIFGRKRNGENMDLSTKSSTKGYIIAAEHVTWRFSVLLTLCKLGVISNGERTCSNSVEWQRK